MNEGGQSLGYGNDVGMQFRIHRGENTENALCWHSGLFFQCAFTCAPPLLPGGQKWIGLFLLKTRPPGPGWESSLPRVTEAEEEGATATLPTLGPPWPTPVSGSVNVGPTESELEEGQGKSAGPGPVYNLINTKWEMTGKEWAGKTFLNLFTIVFKRMLSGTLGN